jgi:restriction system protein
VWDADELLDELFQVYDRLSEATRTALPLKQVWVLDEEAG